MPFYLSGYSNNEQDTYLLNGFKYPKQYYVKSDSLANITGYIFSAVAYSLNQTNSGFDPSETSQVNYNANFGLILPYQPLVLPSTRPLWTYVEGTYITASISSSTFEYFNKNWTLLLDANNATWDADQCFASIEFVNNSNQTVVAIRTASRTAYNHWLQYGPGLTNLTNTSTSGAYPNTTGYITFTDTQLTYTNIRSSNFNGSFNISCDVNSIRKIRISSVSARSTWGGNGAAYVYLKIVKL